MAALEPQYMEILKKELQDHFIQFLPKLLGTKKTATDQAAKQLSRAFSAFALHTKLGVSPKTAASSVVDDFDDNGLDAIYYHEKTDTLYLLQTKLKESEQFNKDDALTFCAGVRLLLKSNFNAFNANVKNRQSEIESALENCSHIQLLIPYTGDGISKTATTVLQELVEDEELNDERLVNCIEYYTSEEIKQTLRDLKSHKPVDVDIGLQKHQKITEPRITYYGVARLSDLVKLHCKEGKALYERNIRYFLGGEKSDVNKSIKNTLNENPSDFFYLNNGVTAICNEISCKGKNPQSGIQKFKVLGLSIINGAQTVASAAEFVDQYPEKNINDAKVMLTLIKAHTDGVFGNTITKARNHQNPVQVVNFASLDENQERLRRESAYWDFDYQYRPEATNRTGEKIIQFEEALRSLALLKEDPRYPTWIKTEQTKLADPDSNEYKDIFSSTVSGTKLINAVVCYRAIRTLVSNMERQAVAKSQEKSIYRHASFAITAVMMKRLRNRIDSAKILDSVEINEVISRPIDQLRQDTLDISRDKLIFEGPLSFFKKLEQAIPFVTDLMKKNYNLMNFRVETKPENLQKLATEKKGLAEDLAERLAKAAPQL